jgi:hypothetical protein
MKKWLKKVKELESKEVLRNILIPVESKASELLRQLIVMDCVEYPSFTEIKQVSETLFKSFKLNNFGQNSKYTTTIRFENEFSCLIKFSVLNGKISITSVVDTIDLFFCWPVHAYQMQCLMDLFCSDYDCREGKIETFCLEASINEKFARQIERFVKKFEK